MSDFSPFEGKKLRGWPVATIKAGKIIALDGKITAKPNGRYLPRTPGPAQQFPWFEGKGAGFNPPLPRAALKRTSIGRNA
jgi:hypothetical protein